MPQKHLYVCIHKADIKNKTTTKKYNKQTKSENKNSAAHNKNMQFIRLLYRLLLFLRAMERQPFIILSSSSRRQCSVVKEKIKGLPSLLMYDVKY